MRDPIELKMRIIESGYKAVEQLIKVAEEDIIKSGPAKSSDSKDDDHFELAADRLKNAAATKKLAIFDALEILNKIELEKESIELIQKGIKIEDTKQGFAERRSIQSRK